MSRLLCLLSIACAAPQAIAPMPPPADFGFAVGSPMPGLSTVWHVWDARPGAAVFLIGSKGSLGGGDCPPQLSGGCLDFSPGASGYRLLGEAVVGSDGRTSSRLALPSGFQPGGTWAVQAVVLQGGTTLSDPRLVDVGSATCADDGFEDNDERAESVPLDAGLWTDLLVCDDDEFSIELGPFEGVEATLTYDVTQLEASLSVYAGSSGRSSNDGLGMEQVLVANDASSSATAFVRVSRRANRGEPWYDLQLERFDIAPCVVDALEDDDVLFDATLLGNGEVAEAVACRSDPDTFAFYAEDGEAIRVTVEHTGDAGSLSAELLDPTGQQLRIESAFAGSRVLTATAPTDGTHFLVVRRVQGDPRGGGVPYRVTPTSYTDVSCSADAMEPNDSPTDAPTLLPLSFPGLQVCVDDIDLFRVDLLDGQMLRVDLTFAHVGGDIDLYLLDDGGGVLVASGSTTDNERVRYTANGDTSVWVEARLFANPGPPILNGNAYALDLSIGPRGVPAACAAGDRDRDAVCDNVDLCIGDDASGDTDIDGLCNDLELLIGADPNDADTDDDGLLDGGEARRGTSPLRPDSNGDGICDGNRVDNDGDGIDPADPCVDLGGVAESTLGGRNGCARRDSGQVFCWGRDQYGLLDPPNDPFSRVSMGYQHACALDPAGAIQCWGRDIYGRLDAPVGVFSDLDAGAEATCALDAVTGAISCWGAGFPGSYSVPAGAFTQVSWGLRHGCAVDAAGDVTCFGEDNRGNTVPPAGPFQFVDAGYWHTCGLRPGGDVECWGVADGSSDDFGQVSDTPVAQYTAVCAGGEHSCAVTVAGDVHCWGSDVYGQASPPNGSFEHVSCALDDGGSNSCGVTTTGDLRCWGADNYGQSSPPPM